MAALNKPGSRHPLPAFFRQKNTLWIIGIILVLICLCCLELYLDRTMEYQTDSDVSSELILARLLAEEGRIVTPNWYYSTEIRLLNTNLVFAPLFRVLNDWHTIRLVGTIILHLIFVFAIFLFCRSTGICLLFPAVALMLILPFSAVYYSFVLRFPYYIPHFVIMLLLLSTMFWFPESKRKVGVVLLISGCILSLLAGLGSARIVVLCLVPLFISVLFPYLREKALSEHNNPSFFRNKYLLFSSACLVAGFLGYYLNTHWLANIFHFKTYILSFTSFNADRMFQAIGGLLQSFGYVPGKTGIRVLIHNATAVFLLGSSVLFAIQGIKTGTSTSSHIAESGQHSPLFLLSGFYLSSLFVFVMLFSFTNMHYTDRYNLPIVILAPFLIALSLKHLKAYRRSFRVCLLSVWIILILASSSLFLYKKGLPKEKSDHQAIADYLVEHDYLEGYATFWNANILTELSNGQVEVFYWQDPFKQADGNVDRINKWLQLVRHDTERPTGKVFLLFQNDQIKPNKDPEAVAEKNLWVLKDERIILIQGDYTVYGYDSYEEMKKDIYDWNSVSKAKPSSID